MVKLIEPYINHLEVTDILGEDDALGGELMMDDVVLLNVVERVDQTGVYLNEYRLVNLAFVYEFSQ